MANEDIQRTGTQSLQTTSEEAQNQSAAQDGGRGLDSQVAQNQWSQDNAESGQDVDGEGMAVPSLGQEPEDYVEVSPGLATNREYRKAVASFDSKGAKAKLQEAELWNYRDHEFEELGHL